MISFLTGLFVLLGLLMPAASSAKTNNIAAELVAEAAPAPGGRTTLAIRFVPKPGWHGYWINPGDAGQPATFEPDLPPGVTLGNAQFPVPQRLVIAGLMNHVYEGEHALLIPLDVARDVRPGAVLPIRLAAQWLACTDSICVPESAKLSLDLTVGNGKPNPASQTRFDGWRRALPFRIDRAGLVETRGDMLRIAIPLPAQTLNEPWLFVESVDAAQYAAPQSLSWNGDWLIVETKASPVMAKAGPLEAVLATGEGRGFAFSASPGTVPAAGKPLNAEVGASDAWTALIAFGGAMLGGLLLNILPCVFPIISLKALSLVRSGESEQAARAEALAYTAGVVLTCLALGGLLLGLRAGGMAVGWAFQLQDPRIVFVLLLLALAITANLLGLFELRGFGGGGALAGQGGAKGAFWTGVLAAFVATPCTGPFMAAALGAALVLPTGAALMIFAGLGLGMALPFLAIGYLPSLRAQLPKPGAWMQTFRRLLAIPMAITALALMWLLAQQTGIGKAWLPASVSTLESTAFSENKLAQERATGRPVFLYFTADWCLTCKVNEKAAIETDAFRDHVKKAGIAVMVGDWTNGDPAITRFLEARGRSGVPLYLYYPKGGEPRELPQILTPSILTAL